jgi:DNA-binding MarR family transcriptional regulator
MVLVYIATHPHETIREISDSLGLTQRRVVAVVKDLADSGLLEVERHGRRNRYRIIEEAPFLHPALSHIKVADFVALMRGADK